MAVPAPATELEKIDAEIEKELQPIRNAKLSPEERIRQIDAAMEKTSTLQEQRKDILRETGVAFERLRFFLFAPGPQPVLPPVGFLRPSPVLRRMRHLHFPFSLNP
ncbi:MAG: hypothetical protein WC076_12690, partial [Terrimicrobiaceae bacterium]